MKDVIVDSHNTLGMFIGYKKASIWRNITHRKNIPNIIRLIGHRYSCNITISYYTEYVKKSIIRRAFRLEVMTSTYLNGFEPCIIKYYYRMGYMKGLLGVCEDCEKFHMKDYHANGYCYACGHYSVIYMAFKDYIERVLCSDRRINGYDKAYKGIIPIES